MFVAFCLEVHCQTIVVWLWIVFIPRGLTAVGCAHECLVARMAVVERSFKRWHQEFQVTPDHSRVSSCWCCLPLQFATSTRTLRKLSVLALGQDSYLVTDFKLWLGLRRCKIKLFESPASLSKVSLRWFLGLVASPVFRSLTALAPLPRPYRMARLCGSEWSCRFILCLGFAICWIGRSLAWATVKSATRTGSAARPGFSSLDVVIRQQPLWPLKPLQLLRML